MKTAPEAKSGVGGRNCSHVALAVLLLGMTAAAATPQQIGENLYAYIADNDSSANSTFLVGDDSILVVDPGLDRAEAGKLLQAIRTISRLPVRYVVNTHYHPDHVGGNAAMPLDALIIGTEFTRARSRQPAGERASAQAELTFSRRITVHVGRYPVEIYFPGKAHTEGDALVYFPVQQAMAMGDLFLNGSCPFMDRGSVRQWIEALDAVLARPVKTFVPGHFALASRAELRLFRDYLADLFGQVRALRQQGAGVQRVRQEIDMHKYRSFRQYPQYQATFADNAEQVFHQLEEEQPSQEPPQ